MEKACIIYGSITGTTEKLALMLADAIRDRYDVTVRNALDAVPEDVETADLILLGSSTWGVGDLQMDMIPVNDFIRTMDLRTKRAAVFGKGDSEYKRFCAAVITLERSLKAAGARLIQKGYRCDKHLDGLAQERLRKWASGL